MTKNLKKKFIEELKKVRSDEEIFGDFNKKFKLPPEEIMLSDEEIKKINEKDFEERVLQFSFFILKNVQKYFEKELRKIEDSEEAERIKKKVIFFLNFSFSFS